MGFPMKYIYRILIFIGLSVIPITAQAHFLRTIRTAVLAKLHTYKTKLPFLYWYQSGIKTGLKLGILTGVAVAPAVKLYPEKKTFKERFRLAKHELVEQTTLLKEHFHTLAIKTKNFFSKQFSKQRGDKYLFLFARK